MKLDHEIQLSMYGFFFANSSTVILNYSHGGVVSQSVAIAVVQALIKRHPEMELGCINLTDLFWTKSLFRRMSFEKRVAREEIELVFFHEIVRKVERYKIPHSLILNLDQTPTKLKYALIVLIAGLIDKRMITTAFTVTMNDRFLPIQPTYGSKTLNSFPRVRFPACFAFCANEKHYSNEQESSRLLDDVIIPCVEMKRKKIGVTKASCIDNHGCIQQTNEYPFSSKNYIKQHPVCQSST